MNRRDRIRRHYEGRIRPGRPSYEVLDWSDPRSQLARFEALARVVPLGGRSLVDVGCGLGDLWAFLQRTEAGCSYVGVDISVEMACAARERHPAACFCAADIFAAPPFAPDTFDVAYCSGAFNLDLGNSRDFLPRAVAAMAEIARRDVVFNLLHRRTTRHWPGYVYRDPDEVLADLAGLGCAMRVVDDYLDGDFTVVCTRD